MAHQAGGCGIEEQADNVFKWAGLLSWSNAIKNFHASEL